MEKIIIGTTLAILGGILLYKKFPLKQNPGDMTPEKLKSEKLPDFKIKPRRRNLNY